MKKLVSLLVYNVQYPIEHISIVNVPLNSTIVTCTYDDTNIYLVMIIDPEEKFTEDRYFKFIQEDNICFCTDELKYITYFKIHDIVYWLFEVKNYGIKSTEFKERFGTHDDGLVKYVKLIAELQKINNAPVNSWDNVDTALNTDDFNALFGKG